MENKYDVVIVGGGPGGLNCAKILAEANKKVLLLEKNSEIGPKPCAGGLTRKCTEYLQLPDSIGGKRFDHIWFSTKRQKTKLDAGDNFVCTIGRDELGQWQKEKISVTAEIRTNAQVTKIGKNELTINVNEKVSFDFLVGADGSNSLVRKYLGLKSKWVGAGIYYVLENFQQDIEICLDSKLFSAWYAWVFPYGKNGVTIGTAAFGKILPLSAAKKNLELWMASRGYGYFEKDFMAHPINCDYRGYRFGNIFLVGDAAGLASPFTGEGIYPALISGEVAARQIIDPEYPSKKIQSLRRTQLLHYFCVGYMWLFGPFRQLQLEWITLITKNKYIARFLLWMLA